MIPVYSRGTRVQVQFETDPDREVAAKELAKIPVVTRVEKRLPIKLLNKWGRGIIEIGARDSSHFSNPNALVGTALLPYLVRCCQAHESVCTCMYACVRHVCVCV